MKRAALPLTALAVSAGLVQPASLGAREQAVAALLDRPLLLTRELRRDMADGEAITLRQEWQITISRAGSGYHITGTAKAVAIDAPPRLARMTSMVAGAIQAHSSFPLMIGADGAIVAAPQSADRAFENTLAQLGQWAAGNGNADHSAMFARLQAASSHQTAQKWPAELLFGDSGETTDSRQLAVANGQQGALEVTTRLARDPDDPAEARLERHIVTRLGGSERRSTEIWKLQPGV